MSGLDLFAGKTILVVIDSDEDTYLYIADDDLIDRYYEKNPTADGMQVARDVGRELTAEEQKWLPNIQGALAY